MVNLSFSMVELEKFLLILVRMATFIFAAPFFSTPNVPRHVRVGLAFFITVIVYNAIPLEGVVYGTVFGYAVIVIKEAIVGLLVGYSANICVSILNFAGHMVDTEIGLSMVSLFDPITNSSVTISGTYYTYMVNLMLLISGMYQYVLAAIVETYRLIPLNGAMFSSQRILGSMIEFATDYIVIGFRLCLPVFVTLILLNAILGILAKVSPQLNMFAVGMQIKILVGLGIMFLTVGILPTASSIVLSEMKKMVTLFVEAMA